MSTRNLDYLFRPGSVVVIGASSEQRSIGLAVMRNLLEGGFAGPILSIGPQHDTVAGVPAYRTVPELPVTPDLAVICVTPDAVPRFVADLGARGTRAVILLGTGLGTTADDRARSVLQATLDEARPHLVRVLGPESVGLLVPGMGLNASLAPSKPRPGGIALLCQSAAVTTGLFDWATANGIGFSHVVALGASVDVDIADVLDYVGSDPDTRAVLVYVEAIASARKFMSAGRAAASNKPVVLLKPAGGASAPALTASGNWDTDEAVFDAAVRRAGMLRVRALSELFGAAEALARSRPPRGNRIAILVNDRALAMLTADALTSVHDTVRSDCVPSDVLRLETICLPVDAHATQYASALRALLVDDESDAVLLVHAPCATVSSEEIAHACVPVATRTELPVLSCWLGGDAVERARRTLSEAGLPTYGTPEQAARALAHLIVYRHNQAALRQTPPSLPEDFVPDIVVARAIVEKALGEGRDALTGSEAKALLLAYRIPVAAARSGDDTVRMGRLRTDGPGAGARELACGVASDSVFGPVIYFGQGGSVAEATRVHAVALPPLNMALAADLVARSGALRRPIDRPRADERAVAATLVKLSQLAADLPEVGALAIDPLFADEQGVLVAAARARIGAAIASGTGRFAIRPYPKELEESIELAGERVVLRPIRGEDSAEHDAFLEGIDPQSLRFRFGREFRSLPRSELARMTQIDYEREMAFIATVERADGYETVGEVRMNAEPDGARAEFAIVMRADFQGKELGRALLEKMIRFGRKRGIRILYGLVNGSNERMLGLARRLGFQLEGTPDARTVVVSLDLQRRLDPPWV